jgi:hypothetical protein
MRPAWGAQINGKHFTSMICEESENHAFRFPMSQKSRLDFWRPYQKRAQINDKQSKSLICEGGENDTFRSPWSKKSRLGFLRPYL